MKRDNSHLHTPEIREKRAKAFRRTIRLRKKLAMAQGPKARVMRAVSVFPGAGVDGRMLGRRLDDRALGRRMIEAGLKLMGI